jgi:hypothetical protein
MINQPPPRPPFLPDQEPYQPQPPHQQADSPSSPDVTPPKKKNNCLLYGLIGVALFSMCAVVVTTVVVVTNTTNSKVNTVFSNIATALAVGSTAKVSTAPSYAEYRAQTRSLSGARQDQYTQALVGERVENWQGIIVDVVKKLSGDQYEIRVDLDHPKGSALLPEVTIDVSKDETLQVTAGQNISFSGIIRSITCIGQFCPVEIDQSIYTAK